MIPTTPVTNANTGINGGIKPGNVVTLPNGNTGVVRTNGAGNVANLPTGNAGNKVINNPQINNQSGAE